MNCANDMGEAPPFNHKGNVPRGRAFSIAIEEIQLSSSNTSIAAGLSSPIVSRQVKEFVPGVKVILESLFTFK